MSEQGQYKRKKKSKRKGKCKHIAGHKDPETKRRICVLCGKRLRD